MSRRFVSGDEDRRHGDGPPGGAETEESTQQRRLTPRRPCGEREQHDAGGDLPVRHRECVAKRHALEMASDDRGEGFDLVPAMNASAHRMAKFNAPQEEVSGSHQGERCPGGECAFQAHSVTAGACVARGEQQVVGRQRRNHRDRGLLAEERDEEECQRPDVSRAAAGLTPSHVAKQRREVEERRHGIDAPGDPGDALGLHRQDGEDESPAKAAAAGDRPTAQSRPIAITSSALAACMRDVEDVVKLGTGRRPFAGQLVGEGDERTDFVRRVAPDVLHPGHDEPRGNVCHGRAARSCTTPKSSCTK